MQTTTSTTTTPATGVPAGHYVSALTGRAGSGTYTGVVAATVGTYVGRRTLTDVVGRYTGSALSIARRRSPRSVRTVTSSTPVIAS
jgi:electron transfer flavoprotein alpha/beta subunit